MSITSRALPIDAVLFNLDGTLMHTAPDIADGVNRMLQGLNLPKLPEATVAKLIGTGSLVLLDRVFRELGVQLTARERFAALQSFQEHCEGSAGTRTTLYPGTLMALEELCGMGLKLAVVTNKHRRLAMRLLQQFHVSTMFDIVVGGDTLELRNPNPLPLAYACDCLGIAASEAIYIGGSINDVEAAKAAGIPVYCVPYGYNEGYAASTLRCAGFIDSIADVPKLIRGYTTSAPRRTLTLA
jgi:phosphoglycolate phosphatase